MEKKSLFYSITADIEVNKKQLDDLLEPFNKLVREIETKKEYIKWLEGEREKCSSLDQPSNTPVNGDNPSETAVLIKEILETEKGENGLMAKDIHQRAVVKRQVDAPALSTIEKTIQEMLKTSVIQQTNLPQRRNRRYGLNPLPF